MIEARDREAATNRTAADVLKLGGATLSELEPWLAEKEREPQEAADHHQGATWAVEFINRSGRARYPSVTRH